MMPTGSRIKWAMEQWAELEPVLRERLAADGGHQAAIDWIVNDLKPRVVEAMTKAPAMIELPEDFKRQVRELLDANSVISLIQMARLEVDLYEARFGLDVRRPEIVADHLARAMPEAPAGSKPN